MLSKIKIPQDTIIIVVVGRRRAFLLNGKFCPEEGDEVVVMGAEENLLEAEKLFYHEANV